MPLCNFGEVVVFLRIVLFLFRNQALDKQILYAFTVDHLLSNGKYVAVVGLEKFLDVQFEKAARCNIDYDKDGAPRKDTRYVSPAVVQI